MVSTITAFLAGVTLTFAIMILFIPFGRQHKSTKYKPTNNWREKDHEAVLDSWDAVSKDWEQK